MSSCIVIFRFSKIMSLWFTLSNPTWACEYR